jgi:hypothetical protein
VTIDLINDSTAAAAVWSAGLALMVEAMADPTTTPSAYEPTCEEVMREL